MVTDRTKYDKLVQRSVRFGGQNAYIPYFWETVIDEGISSQETVKGIEVYEIEVTLADAFLFPELQVGQIVLLHDDGDFILEIDPEQVVGVKR